MSARTHVRHHAHHEVPNVEVELAARGGPQTALAELVCIDRVVYHVQRMRPVPLRAARRARAHARKRLGDRRRDRHRASRQRGHAARQPAGSRHVATMPDGGHPGEPGRQSAVKMSRTAVGMNPCHALPPHQTGQASRAESQTKGVAHQAQRIARAAHTHDRRTGNVDGPLRQALSQRAVAGQDHQGPITGLAQQGRHVQQTALRPAKRRDMIQQQNLDAGLGFGHESRLS